LPVKIGESSAYNIKILDVKEFCAYTHTANLIQKRLTSEDNFFDFKL